MPAHANQALYTIRDVTVDMKADNALAARERAFEAAQIRAFAQLTERLAMEDEDGEATPPDDITLAAMIKDYEVTSEQLSSVRYVGTYTFRFKSDAVKQYFSGQSMDYADTKSDPILLLPFSQNAAIYDLWSDDNEWREAWDRIDTFDALVPVVIPVGDLQDVKGIGDQDARQYDYRQLFSMLQRYGAKEAVIALALPDISLEEGATEFDVVTGAVRIDLFRADKFGPQHVKQFSVKAKDGQTRRQVFDRAVKQVQRALGRDWKDQTVVEVHSTSEIMVQIPITSLGEWTRKQRAIRQISGVSQLKVSSLSPRRVMAKLTYMGEVSSLRQAFVRAQMSLQPISSDLSASVIYELTSIAAPSAGSSAGSSFGPIFGPIMPSAGGMVNNTPAQQNSPASARIPVGPATGYVQSF